jgi:hypothetical protein
VAGQAASLFLCAIDQAEFSLWCLGVLQSGCRKQAGSIRKSLMNMHLAGLAQQLRDTVLKSSGVTQTTLRQAVQARVAAVSRGSVEATEDVPVELQTYLDKVAKHAYKVTDKDVDSLKQAGYSEDAIFELTINAAVAAALVRLECGLQVLQGGA